MVSETRTLFHVVCHRPLVVAMRNPDCWGPSQDDIYEKGHDGGADESRDGNCNEPGDEDVSEQMPVDSLPGAQPTHSYHRAHLCSHSKKLIQQL